MLSFAPNRYVPEKKKKHTQQNKQKNPSILVLCFSFFAGEANTEKKARQPQALGPYNPIAGYPFDVNRGNKASFCSLYEVGAEWRHKEKNKASHTHTLIEKIM